MKGAGNQQDYGMRIYDTRLGRFLSVDPLMKEYPELTPYQFASNTPIQGIDLDGEEVFHYTLLLEDGKKPVLTYLGVQTKKQVWWEFFDNENDFESFNGDEITEKSVEVHVLIREGNGICHAPIVTFNYFKELRDWQETGFAGKEDLKAKAEATERYLVATGVAAVGRGAVQAGSNTKLPGSMRPRGSRTSSAKSTPQGQINTQATAATGSTQAATANTATQTTATGMGTNNPNVRAAVDMGNRVHYDQLNGGPAGSVGLPTELSARFPNTQFRFTPRGARGADVEVVGGTHPSQYPGSTWAPGNRFGDFKPGTVSGGKTFRSDIRKNKLPANTQQLNYNPTTGALQ